MQCNLFWDLMLYKFELGYKDVNATNNICCVKGEGAVDHRTETRRFKRFSLGCKYLNDQAKSGRYKTLDCKSVVQAKEVNLESSTLRVSGELGISQYGLLP